MYTLAIVNALFANRIAKVDWNIAPAVRTVQLLWATNNVIPKNAKEIEFPRIVATLKVFTTPIALAAKIENTLWLHLRRNWCTRTQHAIDLYRKLTFIHKNAAETEKRVVAFMLPVGEIYANCVLCRTTCKSAC